MKKISIATILAILISPAFAQDNSSISFPHGMQIGVGVSATGGLDGFIGYQNKKFDSFWWKRFGVRLGYASTKPLKSTINKGIDKVIGDDGYDIGDKVTITDGKVDAKQMFAMVDFYPFGDTWFLGGLRLSGGYYKGDMNTNANLTGGVTGGAQFKLGDTLYKYASGDSKAVAKFDWKYSGPYAGAGFDLGLFAGLKIYLDAGVVFADDSAKIDMDVPLTNLQQSTNGGVNWSSVSTAQLDLAKADALRDAQRKLDKYDYYPIVKLGFLYRF